MEVLISYLGARVNQLLTSTLLNHLNIAFQTAIHVVIGLFTNARQKENCNNLLPSTRSLNCLPINAAVEFPCRYAHTFFKHLHYLSDGIHRSHKNSFPVQQIIFPRTCIARSILKYSEARALHFSSGIGTLQYAVTPSLRKN